ncbi:hypothetical protein [Komagataeibacter sp. FNDCF1]|uniref:hypothetical protein n=1 Tax=Komagataeibacter sp. FNDCF1 TaxID=2878681 RepID=UPI001E3CE8C9|nr:hypothetical protein [Komagataeibacter sp. FNDCF1]MCE2565175.1 hypothetical protein [Komagataeibacter sp. FNDCF1]
MDRQEDYASAISYEEGRLSLTTGHFDVAMVKQAITRYRRSGFLYHPPHLQPLLVRAGAWLSLRLHELHAWNQGLFSLDGGTLVIHPSPVDTVTMLPIDVHDHGGSLIFGAAENTTGILLVNLVRARQGHAPVQLVFQGCALQFAQYDPMTDITLVGLVPEYELPHGWVAIRMDGNPWHISKMVQPPGVHKPVLRREWQADECETVTLSLSG